jgi:hypothetical protein
MGHKMVAEEAENIAIAFATREWGTTPARARAHRSHIDPSEWVVDVPFPHAHEYLNMDPDAAIVIVDETTRQAQWFPVL